MNKLQKNITYLNIVLTSLSLILYFTIRFNKRFLLIYAKGDEKSFLEIFNFFIDIGFYQANLIGNSTLFNLISFIFYKIIDNQLLALRMTSLLFGILSIVILRYFQKLFFNHIPKTYRNVAFLTSINVLIVSSLLFQGINDLILVSFILLFFVLIYKLLNSSKINNFIIVGIGIIFGLMISTRLMSIVFFIPMIIILFLVFLSKGAKINTVFYNFIILSVMATLTIYAFNYPSVQKKSQLSFHSKAIDHKDVNWSQLQYLSELGYEKGDLKYAKHYTAKQVDEYLKKNGKNSLPNSLLESITFDYKLTLKVFFREFFLLLKPFTRLIGVLFIIGFILTLKNLSKKIFSLKKIIKQYFLIFSLLTISIICLIISSYFETRWVISIVMLTPIFFTDKIYKFECEIKTKNFRFLFLNLQLISLILMNIPFLYKNLF